MQKSINALPTGYRLSAYEIVEELGSGGFGITYKAYDPRLQTHVAIKEYLPTSCAVRETDTISVAPRSGAVKKDYQYGLQMFLREAQTLARFRHERIIRVIQFLEANNTAYLVMEYEHGASLVSIIKTGSYSNDETWVRELLIEILQGLAIVHAASILHRDIKPSNIYIRQDNSPVLLDFGSARYALSGQTMSLTSIVSPGYAPFEQYLSDGNQGPWTDLYGLGATLYWVISGNKPVDATDRIVAVAENKQDPNVSACAVASGKFSRQLLECIDWMLEPKTENRPQTAESIVQRVRGMSNPESTTVSLPVAAYKPSKSSKPHFSNWTRFALFGSLTLGLLAAIASYISIQTDQGPERGSETTEVAPQRSVEGNPKVSPMLAPMVEMPESDFQLAPEETPRSDQGEPIASTEAFGQDRVDELLESGDLAFLGYRLTVPADDSAAYYYREALELSPNNEQAVAGLDRVITTYLSLAEQEWERGAAEKAYEYLELASSVDPDHLDVLAARRAMVALGQKTEAQFQSEFEPNFSPSEAMPRTVTRGDWQDRVGELLAAGNLALSDYRLTTPTGDSAAYYYAKVLKLSPNNKQAAAGLNQVIATYISLAEQKWANGDADKARQYLARASSVDAHHPNIIAARRRMVVKDRSPLPPIRTELQTPHDPKGLTARASSVDADHPDTNTAPQRRVVKEQSPAPVIRTELQTPHDSKGLTARASSVDADHPDINTAPQRTVVKEQSPAPPIRTDLPAPSVPESLISKYPNIRAAKVGYRNREISKVEYKKALKMLATRYKRQIQSLKQLYRDRKLTKRQYKLQIREAVKAYKG